jgi:hypothetical protein
MIITRFKEVPYGAYFRSIFTDALFVRRNRLDGAPVRLSGLADTHQMDDLEFDDDMLVKFLDCESEWPVIDYKPEIQAWDWASLLAFDTVIEEDDELYHSKWIGTTFGVMPSGKVYAFWTSNQTHADVNMDQQFMEALEEVCKEKGVFTSWGESNDLFIMKSTTWEEVLNNAGYEVARNDNGFYWKSLTDEDDQSGCFEFEDDAYRDCFKEKKLVQS